MQDKKVFWYDLETTGLDPNLCGIVQIAFIIEVNNNVEYTYNKNVKPFPKALYHPKALEVNGYTMPQVQCFSNPVEAHKEIKDIMQKYVDPYDKDDKFYFGGYNVSNFDNIFLKNFWSRCGDDYFGSWFNGRSLDARPLLHTMEYLRMIDTKDHKLTTMCKYFNIPLDNAHDALADVTASRALYYTIINSTHLDNTLSFFVPSNVVRKNKPEPEPEPKQEYQSKAKTASNFLDEMEKRFQV